MVKQKQPTTDELIADLQAKNRNFKVAAIACMGLVAAGLLLLTVIGLNTLQRVNTQLAQQRQLLEQQTASTDELKRNTNEQLSKVSKQIDCIAQFFTQRNRTNVVITDLEQCTILNPDGSVTQGSSVGGQTTAPNTGNSGGVSPQPTSNGGVAPAAGNQPQQPQPEPVRVLGVPVCVPLTGVCVRQ